MQRWEKIWQAIKGDNYIASNRYGPKAIGKDIRFFSIRPHLGV
jgi:hypothetical protein